MSEMSEMKREIVAVIKDGLVTYRIGFENIQGSFIKWEDIIENDNLLQELENVFHSHAKVSMDTKNEIARKQYLIEQKEEKIQDLLKMYHEEKAENDKVRERNKRLHNANKDLEQGISRAQRELNRCDHIYYMRENDPEFIGVGIQSAIEIKEVEKGLYKLECNLCKKRF